MSDRNRPVVLLFIDWYLPGFKAGGPIRSVANMVQHLGKDFDFRIVTRNTDYTETTPYPTIESNTWVDGPFSEKVMYLSPEQCNKKGVQAILSGVDYDCVYVNGIYSRVFSILPLELLRNQKKRKVIVASRGMLAPSAIAVKGFKKKLFLKWARLRGLYSHVIFHATNATEEQHIKEAIGKNAMVQVADNFPAVKVIPLSRKSGKESGVLRLVNIARIAPEKNLEFALEMLREVKDGKVRFEVYGPVYNEDYFNRCKSIAEQLPASCEVKFMGPVSPEKITEILMRQDLMFMPTRGENFGHIILESLMAGTPVLTSDQTPFTNSGGVEALPLKEKAAFAERLNTWQQMDEQTHQKKIEQSLDEARKKNDTSPLLERYRQLLG